MAFHGMYRCVSPHGSIPIDDSTAAGLGFLVSYLSYIMIELPFAALTQLLLPSKKPKPKKPPLPENTSTLLNNDELGEVLKDPQDLRRPEAPPEAGLN